MSTFGSAIPISLFGESHQAFIGITIHNLPAGVELDLDEVQNALNRRKPHADYHSARKEPDTFTIVSGFFNHKTTGAPLTILIENKDVKSDTYEQNIIRPGTSDYPAKIKYQNYNDYRGSGHFSGRLTAPLVALGEISNQLLAQKNIYVGSSIKQLYQTKFDSLEPTEKNIKSLYYSGFPALEPNKTKCINTILSIKNTNDSIGGILETYILNLPIGLGEPFFNGFDSFLSHVILSIPSIKGISFGDGFSLASQLGSQANDPLTINANKITFEKNAMGGTLGGLTTGQPIKFQTVIKPTPSIGIPQRTINTDQNKNITYTINGRHDPCIVPRVAPVINALSYYAVLEFMIRNEGYQWIK